MPKWDGCDHRLIDGAGAVGDAVRAPVVRDVVGHVVEEVDRLPRVADVDLVLRGGEEPYKNKPGIIAKYLMHMYI